MEFPVNLDLGNILIVGSTSVHTAFNCLTVSLICISEASSQEWRTLNDRNNAKNTPHVLFSYSVQERGI